MDFFTLVGLSACLYFLSYVTFLWFGDCDLQLALWEKFGEKLDKLRGKVIWVTGASTALGRMMALEGARQGGKLALSSRSVEEVRRTKALCLEMNPGVREEDILVVELDVEELRSQRGAMREVLRHFGSIDIFIMNEDRWERGTWEESTQRRDRELFQSNLFGVLSLSRLAVRYFSWRGRGNIAVASSIAGLIGVPYSGSYAGAKHALHGYFESLRFEKLGEGIQTTLLCLGSSELLQESSAKSNRKPLAAQAPSKRRMTAERCAHLCLAAVVNDLDEVWLAVSPALPLIYGIKYFPNVTKSLLKYLKPKHKPQEDKSN